MIAKSSELYGRYLGEAEKLSHDYYPSRQLEKLLYVTAIDYSKKGLFEEANQNFRVSRDYFEVSYFLFCRLKIDCIADSDKEVCSSHLLAFHIPIRINLYF